MSCEAAVRAVEVSKEYALYARPRDRLWELLFRGRGRRHRTVHALRPVSFCIQRGTTVGIIGRNGSGKSTLLHLVAGTLTPTSGRIDVEGRVAALLELGGSFNPEFTGRENVALYGALTGVGRDELGQRVEEILAFADLGDFADQPVKTYSSGMQVRLGFAAAIHVDPDVLVVDEALAVGDAAFQLKCLERIDEFRKRGRTVVLVSHDVNLVTQLCDRTLLLSKGTLVYDGAPREAVNVYKGILFGGAKQRPREPEAGTPPPAANGDRFGTGEAEIVEVEVLGAAGGQRVFQPAEEATFVFRIRARAPVERPVYGIIVRNHQGLNVYVQNSLHQGLSCPALRADEVQEVRWRQRLHLVAGDYFLSVGVSESRAGEMVALDRRNDVVHFKVIGGAGGGIAHLASVMELR